MLTLITGRVGSGKTRQLMEEVQASLRHHDGGGLFFLVPEQYTLQCERDLTDFLDIAGTLDIQVLSLERLAIRVFSETGGRTRVFLDDQGKAMLIRKVLQEKSEELAMYHSMRPGMVGQTRRFLEDLKRNRIAPDVLEEHIRSIHQPYLRAKLTDLQKIAVGFEEELAGRFLDGDEAACLLLEKMGESPSLQGRAFFADGFTQLTPQSLEVFQKILDVGSSLTMAIPYDDRSEDGSLFGGARHIIRSLEEKAHEVGMEVRRIHLKKSSKTKEIRFLEENLFRFPFHSWDQEPQDLFLTEAGNREDEVKEVLQEIERLVSKGTRYRDITVVCNRLEEYEETFTRLSAQHEIPVFVDLTQKLKGNRFIDYVLLVLLVVQKGFPAAEVFSLLGTGFGPLTGGELDAFENFCLRHGIDRWRFGRPFTFAEEDNEAMERCRQRLMDPLLSLQQSFDDARNIRDYCTVFYHFLAREGAFEALTVLQEDLEEQQEFFHGDRYRQVWNIVLHLLDQMVGIMGDDDSDLEGFSQLLEAGLEERPLAQIPSGIDQVLVGTLDRTKTHDIQVLFVLGFNEGLIPRNPGEDGLLSFHEALRLKETGLDFARDSAALYREEKLSLYLALGKPNRRIFLSYSLVGQEGESLRPSPLLKRIRKIFPGLVLRQAAQDDLDKRWSALRPEGILAEAGVWIGQAAAGLFPEGVQQDRLKALWESPWRDRLNPLVEVAFGGGGEICLSRETTKALYGGKMGMSISRLEKMAACPFAHFVRYGLRPHDRIILKVEPADIGTFYHEALWIFGRKMKENNIVWTDLSDKELIRRLEEAVDEALVGRTREALESEGAGNFLLGQLHRKMQASLVAMVEHLRSGKFQPELFEVKFGPGERLPPLVLPLGDGEELLLRGTIDRVDFFRRDGELLVKLMDYKTGDRSFDYTMFYHGLMLQLTVYLRAMEEAATALQAEEVIPAGAFYFRVGDPLVNLDRFDDDKREQKIRERFQMKGILLDQADLLEALDREPGSRSSIVPAGLKKDGTLSASTSMVSREELDRMKDHTMAVAADLARHIASGQVTVSPYRIGRKLSACTYCDYRSICFYQPDHPESQTRMLDSYKKHEVLQLLKGEGDHAQLD